MSVDLFDDLFDLGGGDNLFDSLFVILDVPTYPLNLSATPTGSNAVNLTWDPPASDGGSPILGYLIERESPVGSGFIVVVANTSTTLTVYLDSSVSPDTEYVYRVAAINAQGTSPYSNEAVVRTLDEASQTRLVSINLGDYTGVALYWDSTLGSFTSPKSDREVLRSSIINILLTRFGERVMRPTFGSRLSRMLFEPNDDITSSEISHEVSRAIHAWDPRVEIQTLDVRREDGNVIVDMTVVDRRMLIAQEESINVVITEQMLSSLGIVETQ